MTTKLLVILLLTMKLLKEVRSQKSEVVFVTGIYAMLQKHNADQGGVARPNFFDKQLFSKAEQQLYIIFPTSTCIVLPIKVKTFLNPVCGAFPQEKPFDSLLFPIPYSLFK